MKQQKKLSIQEMNRLSVDEFQHTSKLPFIIVLDNVRSQHNIGAIFRTADALLIEQVVLCGICSCPPNQEIHKTALGAELSVAWKYYPNTLDAVVHLQQRGYQVYAVEQTHYSTPLNEFTPPHDKPIAIVVGHEVFGVDQAVVDICDGCIEIPQYGTKHSLNVSVASGIVMYDIACKLRK